MGIEKSEIADFAKYFSAFSDCYSVIGGTATLIYLDERNSPFEGENGGIKAYRFVNPTSGPAPKQIEIATNAAKGIPK